LCFMQTKERITEYKSNTVDITSQCELSLWLHEGQFLCLADFHA
jgi:hypothetical protein